ALRCPLVRVPLIKSGFLPRADVIVATSWPVVRDVARLHPSCGRKVHVLFHHEAGTGPEHAIAAAYRLPFHRIAFAATVRDEMANRFACGVHDLLPAGVDLTQWYPTGAPKSESVLMLYHDQPRKGAADGLRALEQVRQARPGLRVRICGTVPPQRLPDWCDFKLHPPDAELRDWYSSSAMLLYSSRYEGFGLPPLEAMACGCPVVSTKVGAVPEYAAGGAAVLVEPGDVDAMAQATITLLDRPGRRQELSERGRGAATRHSLEASAPRFLAALRSARA
ncbi:MAG TPA: glycosyltransferase family 4 protein, partial [Vicinamibacterales bacterium]|nr:glycosyltransferase family 4 protein [Vicinamibacterales bacterium]